MTDVLAGQLAGVTVIDFANKPGNGLGALTHAGADAATTRLTEISTATAHTTPGSTAELSRS